MPVERCRTPDSAYSNSVDDATLYYWLKNAAETKVSKAGHKLAATEETDDAFNMATDYTGYFDL